MSHAFIHKVIKEINESSTIGPPKTEYRQNDYDNPWGLGLASNKSPRHDYEIIVETQRCAHIALIVIP